VISPEGERLQSWRGAGCEQCSGSGYVGRMGIFEMMELNDELRTRIMANEDAGHLTTAARRYGMRSLREDGWRKIKSGVTTVEEVVRVTQDL
jgi:type II secretory ATPase GspE/PulE/Tfp pilus assembly ATPase PilB-like protein